MKDSEIIIDEFKTEAEYLWNSSGLPEEVVHCGITALDEFMDETNIAIHLDGSQARVFGMMLVKKTVDMIVFMMNT